MPFLGRKYALSGVPGGKVACSPQLGPLGAPCGRTPGFQGDRASADSILALARATAAVIRVDCGSVKERSAGRGALLGDSRHVL